MPSRADHQPEDQHYDLTVEVPRNIRHHPEELQAYLDGIAMQLLEAEKITIDEDPDQAPVGGTEGVHVKLNIRPCGPRFPYKADVPENENDPGEGSATDTPLP